MPQKDMPKEVSIMGGCPVPNLCSPLLILAEVEAEGKAKKARLRAQQRGRVAKGKKGRLWRLLRHLRGAWWEAWHPSHRPHNRGSIHPAARAWRRKLKRKFGGSVRQLPPEEKKG